MKTVIAFVGYSCGSHAEHPQIGSWKAFFISLNFHLEGPFASVRCLSGVCVWILLQPRKSCGEIICLYVRLQGTCIRRSDIYGDFIILSNKRRMKPYHDVISTMLEWLRKKPAPYKTVIRFPSQCLHIPCVVSVYFMIVLHSPHGTDHLP